MALTIPPIFISPSIVQNYPVYSSVIPSKPAVISGISIGPNELNASNGTLVDKYWGVFQKDGKVYIQKSII